jgi:hypothetical protein
MTQLPEFKTHTQLTLLAAFAQVDQVLSKSMADILHGAGFKSTFGALEIARAKNVESCAEAMRKAGMNDLYLEQAISQNFAERFAHYWPELDRKISERMTYVHRTAA